MATQTRTIIVRSIATGDGLKTIANQMKEIDKATKDTSKSVDSLKSAVLGIAAAFGIGLGVQQLTGIADSMQLLTDRITAFTGSSEQATKTVAGLVEVANHTKTSIVDLAGVYNRFAISTQKLGLSNEAILSTVQALQQSFRLSGATQEEAAGSTIQLSQAFSLGKLSGQELRSVLLGNSVLAGILRKEVESLGGTMEGFARDGLLTPSFILKALSKNFDDLESRASNLGNTFAGTATTALNDFSVAVGNLNKQLGLSEGFAKFVNFIKENIPIVISLFTTLAILTIPAVIAALAKLRLAALAFIASNPYTALAAVIIGALTYVITNFDKVSLYFKKFLATTKQVFFEVMNGLSIMVYGLFVKPFADLIPAVEKNFKSLQESLRTSAAVAKNEVSLIDAEIAKLENTSKKTNSALTNAIPTNLTDPVKVKSAAQVLKELEEQLGRLNTDFNKGKLDVETYNAKLENLTVKILELKTATGKLSVKKFGEELANLNKENISRLFEYGAITINEYNEALKQLQLGALEQKFRNAKITALEFHQEILKLTEDFRPGSALYVGLNNYIESAGTLSQNVAKGITNTFNTLEDSLMDFIKTGTFEFQKFTQAILEDLTRIILRAAILRPLANGLLDFAGIGAGGGAVTTQANGGVWNQGVQMYANGGIVNRATPFGMKNGNLGVMGEAGPEAILPLTRKNGQLGVSASPSNVYVNITNETGGEVSQTETTTPGGDKIIDILISNKVKESISNGSLDKAFAQNYGLKRAGN